MPALRTRPPRCCCCARCSRRATRSGALTPRSTGARDCEARVRDVLTKRKSDAIGKLTYGAGSKPIEFEDWLRKTRFALVAKHNILVRWWGAVCANARHACDSYITLPPLQRSTVRPANVNEFDGVPQQCEHYMVAHLLAAMPQHI